jgi:uncharacterized protein YacL
MLENISQFKNTNDYLPILIAALLVDMVVILRIVFGSIHIKSLNQWYNKFGVLAVAADTLSIVLGIIAARFLYPFVFQTYSLLPFLLVTCLVQLVHDVGFYYFFSSVPRNASAILDVFKDYAKEVGIQILFVDSIMMISTVLLASYLKSMSLNANLVLLIGALYILPYLLYSIKPIR